MPHSFNYQQTIIFEEPINLLPGDEFIMDCWMDSSDRTDHTTGGESSSQEMCLVFLFYYPAIPMTTVTAGKTPEALGTWMYDAQQAEYLSGDYDDLVDAFSGGWGQQDFSGFEYYSEKDGALEFYNRLYNASYETYNSHLLACNTQEGDLINNNSWEVARNESFEHYDFFDLECENVINADNADAGICQATPKTTTGDVDPPTNDATRFIFMINGLMVLIASLS